MPESICRKIVQDKYIGDLTQYKDRSTIIGIPKTTLFQNGVAFWGIF